MSTTTTPNMSLIVPGVGTEPGPDYATDVNNSLMIIDDHDHSPGKGVQITPAGLNINTALTMNSNFLTDIAGLTLTAQGSTPTFSTLYRSGNNLFFVDGLGNNIQITQNGALFPPVSGNITGLTAPAAASYNSLSQTFVWQSNSTTPLAAKMDMGAALLRNTSPNSTYALTLQPPTLVSNYTITLPLLPAATSFVTVDSSGNMSSLPNLLGALTTTNLSASANIVGTQLSATAAILGSQLATSANILGTQLDPTANILGSQLADTTVPLSKLANPTAAISSSSGAFATAAGAGIVQVTNLSATITAVANRIVKLHLVSDGNPSFIGPTGGGSAGRIYVYKGASIIGVYSTQTGFCIGTTFVDPDLAMTAGSKTYSIKAEALTAGNLSVENLRLLVVQE